MFINSWQVSKTDWTSIGQSAKHFVDEHNIRHRQNLSSVSICIRHRANQLACRQNPSALCTWYDHLSNAIVNAQNQIEVKICVLKASQRTLILIKYVFCLNLIEQISEDPCAMICGLPILLFFVHVCAYVTGWMVENAEFYDICALPICTPTALKSNMNLTCIRNAPCYTCNTRHS